jgi:hypothetical protein
MIVICNECGEEHNVEDVEFVNVEESIEGLDVYYFICPVTGQETNSYVRG